MVALADLYAKSQPERAETLAREALKGLRRRFGLTHPDTVWAEAERIVREAIGAQEGEGGSAGDRFRLMSQLGGVLAAQRDRWDEAEPLLVKAYEGMALGKKQAGSGLFKEAGMRVVDFYTAKGQPGKATEWRRRVEADVSKSERTGQ